jgi:DNA-directed RNA polymerase subunit alpha
MAKQQIFEMPKGVVVDSKTKTDMYARITAEPFEAGFGHTLGNSLRRVLLSSLEGAAITSVKIEGVPHEFSTISGVFEDVTHIILNLKKILFKVTTRKSFECTLKVKKAGDVTAGMLKVPAGIEILNPDHYICSLDKGSNISVEIVVEVGRGYRPAEMNKNSKQPIGVIAIDSLFSPVSKVKYTIEAARVGMKTDYDRLVLEVWTDGRIDPVAATVQSSEMLMQHIDLFKNAGDPMFLEGEADDPSADLDEDLESDLEEITEGNDDKIEDMGLSKRTTNALVNAGIITLKQLIQKAERELMGLRNFGERAINEVRTMLKEHNLQLKTEPATEDEIAELMKKATKKK